MANWYYYNKNGEKIGPISVTALKALVQQGVITRETAIENQSGRTAIAGEVRGLTFPETTPQKATPDNDDLITDTPPVDDGMYGLSSPQGTVPSFDLSASFPTGTLPFSQATQLDFFPSQTAPSMTNIQYEYKCVAAPMIVDTVVNNWTEQEAGITGAVASYGALINRESRDCWEFYSMEQLTIIVYLRPGCLGFLFGAKSGLRKTTNSKMLIFRRPK